MSNGELEELVGSAEAAEIAGVSRRTIKRRVASGELTPIQQLPGPTGALLFRRSDVEALRDAAPEIEDGAP